LPRVPCGATPGWRRREQHTFAAHPAWVCSQDCSRPLAFILGCSAWRQGAGELVEAGDDEVVFEKPVAGAEGFELVVGEDFEGQMNALVQFVLPLLDQITGSNDEAAAYVPRTMLRVGGLPDEPSRFF
jgi:hypothetical protein